MENLAPDIFRQRLLIEAHYTVETGEAHIRDYLLGLAEYLDLRTYGEPVIFAPDTGMGKEDNAGYDAFVPLIDSGISAYVWTGPKFLSALVYTCKGFDETAAVSFTRGFWNIETEIATHSF
ncbi:hypothetical protein [Magnetospira sp. QH-2]|uniref:hypothetical protein n=1 Tax=Magnetospira sp. (strain QH-2) TaxID=1288970 RepID=UPI0005FA1F52|nr:hypothetical protein [Magnetospira sp. QH-2]